VPIVDDDRVRVDAQVRVVCREVRVGVRDGAGLCGRPEPEGQPDTEGGKARHDEEGRVEPEGRP
jgi:hypothetical protein